MNRPRNLGRMRNVLNWMMGGKATIATGEEIAENASGRKPHQLILQVCALIAITGASFWLALNGEWVQQFSHWGYLSAFLISLIASATVILPAPGLLVVFALGASLNPILLGIVAGCGSGLGELSGYLAGATGGELIRKKGINTRLHRLTTRHTAPVLFVLAILPLPIFDFAGILAGALRMPIFQFLATVISGKIIKHIVIAFVGAGTLQMIQSMLGF
jgi:membrane protein YqaA with SNARE-associated domain